MEKKSIIILIFLIIYSVVYTIFIFPKIIKLKWIRKIFGFVDRHPPLIDMRNSGWGCLFGVGALFGLFLLFVLLYFLP